MNALPLPCVAMIANAITAQVHDSTVAGARASTDSNVRLRISQCVITNPEMITATTTSDSVPSSGTAFAFVPAMPRNTTHAREKDLARKNTQVIFTSA